MTANLFRSHWADVDPGELKFILFEYIGQPGQYRDRVNNPNTFYLPLADSSCQIILTFSKDKEIKAIEPGPAFDAAAWEQIAGEIETPGPTKIGRDCSFSHFRVEGSWRGTRSGVQVLPPPDSAPRVPYLTGEHPFILEFPVRTSQRWAITNYRRSIEHRRLTLLLNILLTGRTCMQARRGRHLWAIVPGDDIGECKWVQEGFFTDFGMLVADELSSPAAERIEEVGAVAYYARWGYDGRSLQVPAELDDWICRYTQLCPRNRMKFDRAGFWTDMAFGQWTTSFSASFASLVIAIEAPGDRNLRPTERFQNFMEQYAPGASLVDRRRLMYALRSDILHGSGQMEMDQDADLGWAPPEQNEKDLMEELWHLTRMAMRN